jgi:hypothetical protein
LRAAPDSMPSPPPTSARGKRPGFGLEPPEALPTRLSRGRDSGPFGRPDGQRGSGRRGCVGARSAQRDGGSRADHCLAGHTAPATRPRSGPRQWIPPGPRRSRRSPKWPRANRWSTGPKSNRPSRR